MPTTAELKTELASTHAAIKHILDTGQTVAADGRTLTMAALPDLRKHADWLEGKIAARSGGGRNRLIQVNPIV